MAISVHQAFGNYWTSENDYIHIQILHVYSTTEMDKSCSAAYVTNGV